MDPIFETEVTKIKGNKKFTQQDSVIREVKLEIIVNGQNIGALMSVPVELEELAVGYLMSESIIESVKDIEKIELEDIDTKNFKAVSYTHLTLPTKRIV